jgi:carboxypeptidase C (cathepsin A)
MMLINQATAALIALASLASASNQFQLSPERIGSPLGKPAALAFPGNGARSNVDLHTLSVDQYTSFSHPSFPAHNLRIKQTKDFCDPTVKAYSGYIDADYGAKHLFFYFFESRNDPDKDDVLMWINGGRHHIYYMIIILDVSRKKALVAVHRLGSSWS